MCCHLQIHVACGLSIGMLNLKSVRNITILGFLILRTILSYSRFFGVLILTPGLVSHVDRILKNLWAGVVKTETDPCYGLVALGYGLVSVDSKHGVCICRGVAGAMSANPTVLRSII